MGPVIPRKRQTSVKLDGSNYRLEDQVGFVMRRASQRHTVIFSKHMIGELTPTQWAALVKTMELGAVSQNQLGRDTAMDAATIKGVVDRLIKRGLVTVNADPEDGRRSLIELTAEGSALVKQARPVANGITTETLAGLTESERLTLLDLLRKIS
jgi:MarR family transcriptional regulator, lower aerobic nicotinate degradation pathway regulator